MAKNKFKERFMAVPVEKHNTAAWANIRKTKRVSRVSIPGEMDMETAKEWVDTNQQ